MAVPPPFPSSPPATLADKVALRGSLRARRRAFVALLDAGSLGRHLDAIAARLLPRLAGARCVAGYVAAGSELDPATILAALADRGVTIALPHVVRPDEPMRLLERVPGDQLVAGPFGLQPPADAPEVSPDIFLTPLLGFDRALSRIGQGAGFYDRAFAAHPHARRIGLAWSVQEEPALPLDAWDMPLHAVVTEREWIER